MIKFNPTKTGVLLFENAVDKGDISLMFQNNQLGIREQHKHLGITLSDDCKWHCHIDNVCKSVSPKISMLRKLKYILKRDSLSKIYLTFIRPIMEYSCELWNGCGNELSEKLEKIQLEAARIVTGLPCYASRESLYLETGWEKLIDRRNRRCLCLMYNVVNENCPPYLTDILPPKISEISHYSLRNNDNFSIPRYRLTKTNNSFFPSTLRMWNKLNIDLRNIPTFSQFKRALTAQTYSIPKWFHTGTRKMNILHTRLRHNFSALNFDLFRCNLRNDATCLCGYPCENAYHFFMECPLYNSIRHNLFIILQIYGEISLHIILYGRDSLNVDQNVDIFSAVHNYIKSTHRFD